MTNPSHPGLGEATDISAADLSAQELAEADAPVPATSDADQMDDAGLGTGDGADVQPGGAG